MPKKSTHPESVIRRAASRHATPLLSSLGFLSYLTCARPVHAEPVPPAPSERDAATKAPPPEVQFQDVPVDPPPPAATPPAATATPPLTSVTPAATIPAPATPIPALNAPRAPTAVARPFPNAFPVFRQHVEQARTERIGSSIAKLLIGGAAIPLGVVAENEWGNAYAQIIWIGGVGSVISGVFGLAFSSSFERMGDTFRVDANQNPTPREEARLVRSWGAVAENARSSRVSSAWVGLVVGAAVVGAGGVIVGTGIGDLDQQTREDWATALILAGAFSISNAVADFFIQTPVERGYHAYKASVHGDDKTVQLGFLPVQRGGGIALRATF